MYKIAYMYHMNVKYSNQVCTLQWRRKRREANCVYYTSLPLIFNHHYSLMLDFGLGGLDSNKPSIDLGIMIGREMCFDVCGLRRIIGGDD